MKREAVVVGVAGLVCAGTACGAVNGLSFTVSGVVSPDNPSVTVEVWAYFDPAQYAFAAAKFDVQAGEAQFTNPLAILNDIGYLDGIVSFGGDAVTGIVAGQLNAPVFGYFADTANPILIWQATWGTTDFTPRTVSLDTLSSKFRLHTDDIGHSAEFIDEDFAEAVGEITVVPAPAAGALGLMMILMSGSRRR